ncbi:MAG: hypothetical protein ACE5F1_16115, partial [Planctomycetota bacterium]
MARDEYNLDRRGGVNETGARAHDPSSRFDPPAALTVLLAAGEPPRPGRKPCKTQKIKCWGYSIRVPEKWISIPSQLQALSRRQRGEVFHAGVDAYDRSLDRFGVFSLALDRERDVPAVGFAR